jgi:hypothetical protein
MNRTGLIALWSCVSLFGVMVFVGALQLSQRYNAWTTTLRRRHPRINPPPTEQARKLNEAIMMWLFRIVGAYFVVMALLALIRIRFSN